MVGIAGGVYSNYRDYDYHYGRIAYGNVNVDRYMFSGIKNMCSDEQDGCIISEPLERSVSY